MHREGHAQYMDCLNFAMVSFSAKSYLIYFINLLFNDFLLLPNFCYVGAFLDFQGYCFVKFSSKEMALAAIKGLNRTFTMRVILIY
jgi:hypothetical protein